MNDLYKEQLDVLVQKNREQAEQIAELKHILSYAVCPNGTGEHWNPSNEDEYFEPCEWCEAKKQALAAQPQKGQDNDTLP